REFKARDARGEAMLDDLVDFGGKRRAHDHDGGGGPGRAKLDSLVKRGNAEHRDPRVHRGARDLHGPVPIGIGFHDEQDLAAVSDRGLDGRDVPAETIQVYFSPRGKFRHGLPGSGHVTSTTGRVAAQAGLGPRAGWYTAAGDTSKF